MRRITRAAALLFFVALLPVAALAQTGPVCAPTAGQGGILTGLAHQFSTTTGPWMTTALHYAQGLFFALVGDRDRLVGDHLRLAEGQLAGLRRGAAAQDPGRRVLLHLVAAAVRTGLDRRHALELQPGRQRDWRAVAVHAQRSELGLQLRHRHRQRDAAERLAKSRGINLGNLLPAIEAILAALICALGVVIAFAIIAGQLLITLIESYIVIGAGVFMLGFTGSRWTLVFGEKYVGYAVSVGIKLFMLELIVGLGYGLGQQWAALFCNGIAPPETYIEVVGAALVFGFLAWQIPSLAASLMNGAPRMTLGSFVNTAGAVAVGGVVVGSGVGALVAGAHACRRQLRYAYVQPATSAIPTSARAPRYRRTRQRAQLRATSRSDVRSRRVRAWTRHVCERFASEPQRCRERAEASADAADAVEPTALRAIIRILRRVRTDEPRSSRRSRSNARERRGRCRRRRCARLPKPNSSDVRNDPTGTPPRHQSDALSTAAGARRLGRRQHRDSLQTS